MSKNLPDPFPACSDITVLPADSKRTPIGFVCRTYEGSIVSKPDAPDEPLTTFESIQPGDQLVIHGLYGSYLMTAELDVDGELVARGKESIALLEFDADDRHCWTSPCVLINTQGTTKTSVTKTSVTKT